MSLHIDNHMQNSFQEESAEYFRYKALLLQALMYVLPHKLEISPSDLNETV